MPQGFRGLAATRLKFLFKTTELISENLETLGREGLHDAYPNTLR